MFTYKLFLNDNNNVLFTYFLKSEKYIVITPTDEFYKKFGSEGIIKNVSQIIDVYDHLLSPIFINKTSVTIECSFYDNLVYDDIAFDIIQFYINNIGEYIDFEYTTDIYSYWTFSFKITNYQLLLELL